MRRREFFKWIGAAASWPLATSGAAIYWFRVRRCIAGVLRPNGFSRLRLGYLRLGLLCHPRRYLLKQRAQPFSHCWMRKICISKARVGKARQHCGLHRRHNLPSRGTNHREAKDAIVAVANESFHKTLPLIGRLRTKYSVHRQRRDAGPGTLAFRLAFAQSYAGQRGISEHAIWNQPIVGASISPCKIVTYNSKIVFGYVRELRTAGAFAQRPNIWRTCLQSAIDLNVTASVQFNPGSLKSNSSGIRNTPRRDQDVAAIDALITRRCAYCKRNLVSRSPAHLEQFGVDKHLNIFGAKNAPHFP